MRRDPMLEGDVFAARKVKDTSGCYAAKKKKKFDETGDFISSFSDLERRRLGCMSQRGAD